MLCCVVSATVAQKNIRLRHRLFMGLSCALLGHVGIVEEGFHSFVRLSRYAVRATQYSSSPSLPRVLVPQKSVAPSLCGGSVRASIFLPTTSSFGYISASQRGPGYRDSVASMAPKRAMLGTANHEITKVVWVGRFAS